MKRYQKPDMEVFFVPLDVLAMTSGGEQVYEDNDINFEWGTPGSDIYW